MLNYFKENKLVRYAEEQPHDWQEAIRVASQSLIDNGFITVEYVDEIIQNVITNGPYIIIAEQIAMPHAAGDSPGVLGTGISFTKFPQEVLFKNEETDEIQPATLFFTLAAKDAESHLDNITRLMDLLMDEEKVEALMASSSLTDFDQLLN